MRGPGLVRWDMPPTLPNVNDAGCAKATVSNRLLTRSPRGLPPHRFALWPVELGRLPTPGIAARVTSGNPPRVGNTPLTCQPLASPPALAGQEPLPLSEREFRQPAQDERLAGILCEFRQEHGEELGAEQTEQTEARRARTRAEWIARFWNASTCRRFRALPNRLQSSWQRLAHRRIARPIRHRSRDRGGPQDHPFGQVIPIEDAEKAIDQADSVTSVRYGCRFLTAGKASARPRSVRPDPQRCGPASRPVSSGSATATAIARLAGRTSSRAARRAGRLASRTASGCWREQEPRAAGLWLKYPFDTDERSGLATRPSDKLGTCAGSTYFCFYSPPCW